MDDLSPRELYLIRAILSLEAAGQQAEAAQKRVELDCMATSTARQQWRDDALAGGRAEQQEASDRAVALAMHAILNGPAPSTALAPR